MNFEDIDLGTEHELTDAKEIARLIMDPDEEGIITQWAQYGHLFLSAYIIHLLNDETPTLSTIRNRLMELPANVLLSDMLYSSSKTVNDVALELLKEPESFQEKYVQTALRAIQDYMARQERYTAI
jgi:hypothetical protein